jgi:hypothetical protein
MALQWGTHPQLLQRVRRVFHREVHRPVRHRHRPHRLQQRAGDAAALQGVQDQHLGQAQPGALRERVEPVQRGEASHHVGAVPAWAGQQGDQQLPPAVLPARRGGGVRRRRRNARMRNARMCTHSVFRWVPASMKKSTRGARRACQARASGDVRASSTTRASPHAAPSTPTSTQSLRSGGEGPSWRRVSQKAALSVVKPAGKASLRRASTLSGGPSTLGAVPPCLISTRAWKVTAWRVTVTWVARWARGGRVRPAASPKPGVACPRGTGQLAPVSPASRRPGLFPVPLPFAPPGPGTRRWSRPP